MDTRPVKVWFTINAKERDYSRSRVAKKMPRESPRAHKSRGELSRVTDSARESPRLARSLQVSDKSQQKSRKASGETFLGREAESPCARESRRERTRVIKSARKMPREHENGR